MYEFSKYVQFAVSLSWALALLFCLAAHVDAGADVRYVRRVLVAVVRSTRDSIHTWGVQYILLLVLVQYALILM